MIGNTKTVADVAVVDEPIQLADAKRHLRVDDFGGSHPDDTYIRDILIPAAREYAEHYCGRKFAKQQLCYSVDAFPCDGQPLDVELGPVGTLDAIAYRDVTDTAQAYPVGACFIDDSVDNPTTIGLVPAITAWPVAGARPSNVQFTYTTKASCPRAVKSAMLLIIGHMYENRSESITGTIITALPLGVANLLNTANVERM